MRLEGRRALVTGGASGIGAATARRLAAEGADVVIGDLNEEGGTTVAGEISATAARLDVTDPASAGALAEKHGPFAILVNNAGTDEFGFFADTDPGVWERVIAVNLMGVLACTHAVLPGMQEAGYGRIVNVSSEAGRIGSKGSVAYSSAKGGVLGFTKAMAREGARFGITVNAICPGPDRDSASDGRARVRRDRREGDRNDEGGDAAPASGNPGRGCGDDRVSRVRRRLVRDRRDAGRLRRDGDVLTGEPTLEPGAERKDTFAVEDRLLTDVGGTIGSSVLSTPGMIAMMERNSAILAMEHLPEGTATVGFEVCVKHVAAALEGTECIVRSTLREVVDGRKLRFEVEVTDRERTIGVGTHERRVIQVGQLGE